MDVGTYQGIIEKTAVFPREQVGLAYCGLGLTGEAGEVAEKIKKLYRDQRDLVNLVKLRPDNLSVDQNERIQAFRQALKKELGDVLWYVTATANEVNLSLAEIMEANYEKLIKRRETNTLHGSGDDREENT